MELNLIIAIICMVVLVLSFGMAIVLWTWMIVETRQILKSRDKEVEDGKRKESD